MAVRLMLCVFLLALSGCGMWDTGPDRPFVVDRETPPQRLNARSPWYPVGGEQVKLYANYCGWDVAQQKRILHMEIGDKVKEMVAEADEQIVAAFFLFDNLYANQPAEDYVEELTELLIEKKKANPKMPIVLILDLFHKGWGHRQSQVVDRLVKAGVDVFYSDLLETRSARRVGVWEGIHEAGRAADRATGGVLGAPWQVIGNVPLPLWLDGQFATVDTVSNGMLLKANHRKWLVTKRRGEYEVLTTSWNPHNPSLLHENHAISVTGALARYVYMVLREDMRMSLKLQRSYTYLSDESDAYSANFLTRQLPALEESAWRGPAATSDGPEAAVATEEAIEPILMQWLSEVGEDDQVRIQMFYLARVPVVNAILDAAKRTREPIRILLDANRTGINYVKDGTPNAPVADYLMERARMEGARIEIRWYSTHGEQNHAKAMTITNEKTGKYLLTLGSANWTRKNLGGINLENNIFVRKSAELNGQFNALFDRQWSNDDAGIEYSVAWDDPRYNYQRSEGRDRWAVPRRDIFFRQKLDDKRRPQLLEQEVVHW